MSIVSPRQAQRTTFRYIMIMLSMTTTLLTITGFAVYYGGLMDRFTSDFLQNTSSFLQNLPYGLGFVIATLCAGAIIIGPLDYYLDPVRSGNLNLIITILLIYFIASIFIGLNVSKTAQMQQKNQQQKSAYYYLFIGFIMGFGAFAVFNGLVYLILNNFMSLLEGYAMAELMGEIIVGLGEGLLSGMFGDDVSSLLIRGIFINGTVYGVYGAFWSVVFLPSSSKNVFYIYPHEKIDVICEDLQENESKKQKQNDFECFFKGD